MLTASTSLEAALWGSPQLLLPPDNLQRGCCTFTRRVHVWSFPTRGCGSWCDQIAFVSSGGAPIGLACFTVGNHLFHLLSFHSRCDCFAGQLALPSSMPSLQVDHYADQHLCGHQSPCRTLLGRCRRGMSSVLGALGLLSFHVGLFGWHRSHFGSTMCKIQRWTAVEHLPKCFLPVVVLLWLLVRSWSQHHWGGLHHCWWRLHEMGRVWEARPWWGLLIKLHILLFLGSN